MIGEIGLKVRGEDPTEDENIIEQRCTESFEVLFFHFRLHSWLSLSVKAEGNYSFLIDASQAILLLCPEHHLIGALTPQCVMIVMRIRLLHSSS